MTDTEKFARHIALPDIGAEGQQRLAASSILIIGLGGLGCPAAQYLAGSGVGRLMLNDYDRVDRSNLPRQILFSETDVGRLKVEVAAEQLARLGPSISIELLSERLSAEALHAALADADIVLDCTDNFTTRLMINEAAVAAGKPLVSGAALRLEGQVVVFANDGNGPCYRCLYSEDDEMLGSCAGNGVLASVPGVIGTMMATEAILLAVGVTGAANGRSGRLRLWDAVSGDWQTVNLGRDPQCPVCNRENQ